MTLTPEQQAAIDDLIVAFERALAQTNETADPSPAPKRCRYCGKRWDRMPGSKLDGHSLCMVTPEFRARVVVFQRDHWQVSTHTLAASLGVTPPVLRSWTHSRSTGWLGGQAQRTE